MKNNLLKVLSVALAALMSAGLYAQTNDNKPAKEDADGYSLKAARAGQVSIGLEFNPVAAAKSTSASALAGTGKFMFKDVIGPQYSKPQEMFFLAQNPMASFAVKYKISEVIAIKGSIGFSGGVCNYREYVQDDAAVAKNPLSEAQVADLISFHYTGGGINFGVEFTGGKKSLRFIGGVGLKYAWGGGYSNVSYGNQITSANQKPTTMAKIDTINKFPGAVQMEYGRPVKQYGVGVSQGVGIYASAGIEWFFIKNVSLGFTVDIVPLMVAFQPQTYVIYEGYNKYSGQVDNYNQLVSPGSTYLLYGTDNIGCTLALHYYFK